ncbi:MAG: hypothetical protein GX852_02335, partial [Clostridiales bacterium]|nr:hypothetical protein [Clostridiales bacterium]
MKTNNRYMKSEIITNKNGKKQIEGEYIYEEMLFKFHGCEQKGKNPGLRGTISAIDIKGIVLKKRIVNTKDPSKKTKKRISCEFTTPSLGLEESKTEIDRVIQRLYSKNSSYIVRELGRKCNPETISIILAAEKYAPQFVSITFPKGNPETQKRTVRKLTRLCAKFSSKAMRDYTEEDVNSIIRINNMSVKDVNLLISFWNYLIVTNHVYGSN